MVITGHALALHTADRPTYNQTAAIRIARNWTLGISLELISNRFTFSSVAQSRPFPKTDNRGGHGLIPGEIWEWSPGDAPGGSGWRTRQREEERVNYGWHSSASRDADQGGGATNTDSGRVFPLHPGSGVLGEFPRILQVEFLFNLFTIILDGLDA